MKEKTQTSNDKDKPPQKPKPASATVKSLGPVHNLEEHVEPEWWRQIFNSIYLKTDGDVVDDPQLTSKEVDIFLGVLNLTPTDRILDLCCGQGRDCL